MGDAALFGIWCTTFPCCLHVQGSVDMATLSNAFARSNLMEAQASGQLPPRQESAGLHSKRTSRDYSGMEPQASDLRRQYDVLILTRPPASCR